MLGSNFYFQLTKKYVAYFGSLFNNIYIERTLLDANGVPQPTQQIKVPIQYAPKMKTLTRIEADPGIDKPAEVVLPRMSFEMVDWSYDPDRKLNTIQKVARRGTDTDHFYAQYNPVPYNIQFNLYIYCKNAEDGTKIIEQILPYFTPDWTQKLQLIETTDIRMDIPVILQKVSTEDLYTGDFKTRRSLIWTLQFNLKGYFYGPIRNKPIIKFVTGKIHVSPRGESFEASIAANNQALASITVQPGLDANGNPTTNSSISVNVHTIDVNSDYGYVETIVDPIINE